MQIKTGEYYACKVINKKLMEGREYMVRFDLQEMPSISLTHTLVLFRRCATRFLS